MELIFKTGLLMTLLRRCSKIIKVNSDWYSIRNINSQKDIDVAGGNGQSDANVHLYRWNGSDAQLWQFCNADSGYYFIKIEN